MKPSIGRIVHYAGPGNQLPPGEPGHIPATTYPAIVLWVHDDEASTGPHPEGLVDLHVWTRIGEMKLQRVPFSSPPSSGCWSWPPRV